MVLAEIYFKMDRLQECESLCQKVIGTVNPKKASSPEERDSLVYHLCSGKGKREKKLKRGKSNKTETDFGVSVQRIVRSQRFW